MILEDGIEVSSNGSKVSNELMEGFIAIHREHRRVEAELRILFLNMGFVAAHVNDGWVTRSEQGIPLDVVLAYPLFQAPDIAVGQPIAIYRESGVAIFDYHICEVTNMRDNPWALDADRSRKYFLKAIGFGSAAIE